MQGPGRDVDIRSPPPSLDDRIDWFGQVSEGLVQMEDYSLSDVAFAVDQIEISVREHLRSAAPEREDREGGVADGLGLTARIQSEHSVFPTSLRQLRWFFGIVAHEDHGGHRQALGQYGKVLAEALQRHREDELHS
ncbi:MAG: hypothetical protein WB809_06100 [Thermoplasmata archaeon]